MTLVILARHGNNFEPGQEPVWIGARSDPPLTSKGREQAVAIGAALRRTGLIPARTISGPLKRTMETATLALHAAGGPANFDVDERLREIDYGAWEGKSSQAIRMGGDQDELDAWERDGTWPSGAGWPLSREDYQQRLSEVLQNIRDERREPTLVVSSNGIFKLLARTFAGATLVDKLATGRLALLSLTDEQEVRIIDWNVAPEDFVAPAPQ